MKLEIDTKETFEYICYNDILQQLTRKTNNGNIIWKINLSFKISLRIQKIKTKS